MLFRSPYSANVGWGAIDTINIVDGGYSYSDGTSTVDVIINGDGTGAIAEAFVANNKIETIYKIELEFKNPSLLTLPAGETEFFVSYDNQIVGKGNLESFTLNPLSSSFVEGTFTTETSSNESKSVKISGITKYDLLITSIDIPFEYYPSEEQTRKFIQ